MTYSALIADVIKSRAYEKEKSLEAQVFIKSAINWLNNLFAGKLKAKIVISSGDEMQGLFFKPESAFSYYRLLKLLIFPMDIRAGCGIGAINYETDWESNELRGDAYYYAREAIEACKRNGADILFCSKGADDKYINRLARKPKRLHTKATNLIDTAAEFFYPLCREIAEPPIEELDGIIRYKRGMTKGAYCSGENPDGFRLSYSQGNCVETGEGRTASDKASTVMYLDNFWGKGFSTRIAGVLGVLRQTVDRHIKKHMLEERNIDGTALTFLIEKYSMGTV